ncbi:MAG: DUF2997 domain-containing protein [Solidesulfovibrio sp.]|uniref:DUF2997 domain-containing protein n=1 Tax=Solidesulfovibrio sp. TaxID=2910990 RepID=UPI0031594BB3
MSKQIIVDIAHDGEVRIETKGFTGPICLEESQFIKDLLGQETARCLAPMFYQRGKTRVKKHIPLCG